MNNSTKFKVTKIEDITTWSLENFRPSNAVSAHTDYYGAIGIIHHLLSSQGVYSEFSAYHAFEASRGREELNYASNKDVEDAAKIVAEMIEDCKAAGFKIKVELI